MLYHKPASSAWPACSWAHSTNDCLIAPFVLLTGECEWEERKTLSKQAVLTISIELHGCSSAQQAGPQGKRGGLSQCQTDFGVYKNNPLHFYFFSAHNYSKRSFWSTFLWSVFLCNCFSLFIRLNVIQLITKLYIQVVYLFCFNAKNNNINIKMFIKFFTDLFCENTTTIEIIRLYNNIYAFIVAI